MQRTDDIPFRLCEEPRVFANPLARGAQWHPRRAPIAIAFRRTPLARSSACRHSRCTRLEAQIPCADALRDAPPGGSFVSSTGLAARPRDSSAGASPPRDGLTRGAVCVTASRQEPFARPYRRVSGRVAGLQGVWCVRAVEARDSRLCGVGVRGS
ncbi:hypothetical protein BV25DRAFT_1542992 [Artomyces pyxidatus]|uniref:Uncharacterized protein n=1 Tax=Artomyces pyxidatus TaxID=48021 RepID=A0ACB8SK76_9AGAM|nr:hypothetical protein BV25DRAFT_1542992 [Artomyces pyxidatus]